MKERTFWLGTADHICSDLRLSPERYHPLQPVGLGNISCPCPSSTVGMPGSIRVLIGPPGIVFVSRTWQRTINYYFNFGERHFDRC